MMPTINDVIALLCAHEIILPPGNVRLDYYGDSRQLSISLLNMVRSGQKRAGTSLLWWHEHEAEPYGEIGDIDIVMSYEHVPSIVTRITSVQVVAYCEVTPEYAAIEGEGDGSLAYWREAHWEFFSRECDSINRKPTEDMPVVCSTFEVLHIL